MGRILKGRDEFVEVLFLAGVCYLGERRYYGVCFVVFVEFERGRGF